jgi:Uma2 family endonuclease
MECVYCESQRIVEGKTMTSFTLNLDAIPLTDDQFYQLCQDNQDLRLELTSHGELIVMPPVGGESGKSEANFIIDVGTWNRRMRLGEVFSSSTVFRLPSGSQRSPDVAWIATSRWEALTPEQRRKFPPIAPDFVIELRSATDSLGDLQSKIRDYLDNQVRLGWLIDPQNQQVEVYRLGQAKEVRTLGAQLSLPSTLSGEDVLPEFSLRIDAF